MVPSTERMWIGRSERPWIRLIFSHTWLRGVFRLIVLTNWLQLSRLFSKESLRISTNTLFHAILFLRDRAQQKTMLQPIRPVCGLLHLRASPWFWEKDWRGILEIACDNCTLKFFVYVLQGHVLRRRLGYHPYHATQNVLNITPSGLCDSWIGVLVHQGS